MGATWRFQDDTSYFLPNLFAPTAHLFDRQITLKEPEFLTPKASCEIRFALVAGQDKPGASQGFITGRMTIPVVDGLEVIEVQKQQSPDPSSLACDT